MWSTLKFIASVALLVGVTVSSAGQIKVGDVFPALASVPLVGGAVPSIEGKVVLVDFWASWCPPCKASFPALARIHADYAEKGLVIVAVSVDEKAAAFEGFVKKLSPPFAALHDASQALVQNVQVPTMPTSYLIGRDGRVRFIHAGYHGDATEHQLRQHIEAVLAENT